MTNPTEAVMLMMHLDTGRGLAVLDLPGTVLLETDSLDGNEARCVLRSLVHVQSIHAALIRRVEVRGLAGTSNDTRAACRRQGSLCPRLGAVRT